MSSEAEREARVRELEAKIEREQENFIIKDPSASYLMELPYWSGGKWTKNKNKAKSMNKTQALEIIKIYPQLVMELK